MQKKRTESMGMPLWWPAIERFFGTDSLPSQGRLEMAAGAKTSTQGRSGP